MKGIISTKEIYREIVPKIIQDEDSWGRFLTFSAVHYQMGFENASLLYAQMRRWWRLTVSGRKREGMYAGGAKGSPS